MTRTVHISLGTSLLTGKQAVDQTQRFREQLYAVLKKPEHVSVILVEDPETHRRSVAAFYDADDTDAATWASQAAEMAPELWAKLAERRKGSARA